MPQRRANWAWLVYTVFIVYGGTIPFHFAADHSAIAEKLHQLPLSPWISPDTGRRLSIPDAVQNILFFVPFGALGFLARRGQADAGGFKPTVLLITTFLGFVLSLFVESLQLLTADRVASVADVTTNTLGAFAGAAGAWILHDVTRAGLRRLSREGLAVPELYPLVVSSTVVAIAFLQPFDVTIEVGAVMSDVRLLERDVWQFTVLRNEGIVVILCAFFSATLASYLSVLEERWAGLVALVSGAVFLLFLEGSQLFIGSRTPGVWDLTVACTGLLVGLALWRLTPRLRAQETGLGILAMLTLTAASIQMLSPFELATEYRGVGWLPFRGYYTRTTFETLSHVIELALLYFPFGYWMGASSGSPAPPASGPWDARRRALAVAIGLTLGIAGVVEYFQGWVVGRYPDISDVGLSVAGGLAGFWAGSPKGLGSEPRWSR
jgi:glycopeptide antibiotics resistance protein